MDSTRPPASMCLRCQIQPSARYCNLGGLRTVQHNETRDFLAQCMREAGHIQVETEPKLQPLSGESFEYKSANKDDEARSDIKCYGFWKHMRQAFFDVKVVSPYARMPT